jgi:AcrR family transcriptional regulator
VPPPRARSLAAPPRTRRRAAEIIDAAARVFAERGYHGASTQDIADRLGIRQASLYYYFASKEEALEQVCMLGVEGFVERAAEIAATDQRAASKIAALVAAHLAPLGDRRDYVRVFLRERGHLPDASRKRVGRLSRRLERLIEATFAAGIATGEFRPDLDARLATLGLLGMCNAVPTWLPVEGSRPVEQVSAAFATLILDGARAPAGPQGKRLSRRSMAADSIGR